MFVQMYKHMYFEQELLLMDIITIKVAVAAVLISHHKLIFKNID